MPLISNRSKIFRWLVKNPIYSGLLLSLAIFTVVVGVVLARIDESIKSRSKNLGEVGLVLKRNVDQYLYGAKMAATALSFAIDQNGAVRDFDNIAADIHHANASYQCLQLVPQGVIRYVYPLKSNQMALNLNINKSIYPAKFEAIQNAADVPQINYYGPVRLKQGAIGVVGRMPIFVKNKFWGFSAVVIRLDTLLAWSGITKNSFKNYRFQFAKIEKDRKETFYLPSIDHMFSRNYAVIRIPEGNWKLYIVGLSNWEFFLPNLYYLLLGFVLAGFSGYLFYNLLRSRAALDQYIQLQTQQVYKAEHQYKSIFESATVGIGRIDSLTGMFLEVNQFLCDFLGYHEQDLLNKKIKSLIFEDDLPGDRMLFKKLLSGQLKSFKTESRYLHRTGEIVWGKVTIKAMWQDDEQPNHHLLIVEDITADKKNEIRLLESQTWVTRIINSVDGIVYEANMTDYGDVVYTFVSDRLQPILGYSTQEWLSTANIQRTKMHPEDRKLLEEYSAQPNFSEHHDLAYRIITADGRYVWIRNIFSHQLERGSVKLTGIMLDITSSKLNEQSLAQTYKLVSEQNERLLNFSHIVSHNLRSHASNIEGISVLIEMAKTDADRDEMIQLLKKVAGNLNETLFNLNNIVNIQTSINVIKEPIHLNEFVLKTLATQNAHILDRDAEIINQVPEDISVVFNKAYLESVLLNLISNALRYADPSRRPVITITCCREDDKLVLRVSDNGIGIDMNKNGDKIFGLYQTFNGNDDARGFGLFITKNQVEAMGGQITLESAPNKGSTFKIFFN